MPDHLRAYQSEWMGWCMGPQHGAKRDAFLKDALAELRADAGGARKLLDAGPLLGHLLLTREGKRWVATWFAPAVGEFDQRVSQGLLTVLPLDYFDHAI